MVNFRACASCPVAPSGARTRHIQIFCYAFKWQKLPSFRDPLGPDRTAVFNLSRSNDILARIFFSDVRRPLAPIGHSRPRQTVFLPIKARLPIPALGKDESGAGNKHAQCPHFRHTLVSLLALREVTVQPGPLLKACVGRLAPLRGAPHLLPPLPAPRFAMCAGPPEAPPSSLGPVGGCPARGIALRAGRCPPVGVPHRCSGQI